MSFAQTVRGAASSIAQGGDPRQAVSDALGEAAEGFGPDPRDFLAAREQGASVGTRIEQQTTSLNNAGEALNRSSFERGSGGPVHVICPMVIPRGRTFTAMLPVILLLIVGVVGQVVTFPVSMATGPFLNPFFGVHYWVLLVAIAAFLWWRQGLVMVPDGCAALITRFGKLEQIVGPGRVTLFNPWKRVSYIVNTTREYPFNAPIREAPTKSGVKASIDLFVQFKIEDPEQFIFVLGAVQGFQEKLNNAISEVTRSLIYDQQASEIYDMVGENTARLLEQLNQQFLPAVRLTNANITHAEPSSQEYRMDLAAPEMVRVAKEAYTYEYELQLRKEQNEGDLNKELASLNETLSAIQADIAQYQAQMDTALERETNRARAQARERFVEAESTANANAALLEAQALDIRAVSAAEAPEILNYRYQQDLLDKLESVADSLPQVLHIGGADDTSVDFLRVAQNIIGEAEAQLFSDEDMAAIRSRLSEISQRIADREAEIARVLQADEDTVEAAPVPEQDPNADRIEEIRQSVADNTVEQRLGASGGAAAPQAPQQSPAEGEFPAPDGPPAPWPQNGAPGPNEGGPR
ncbi:SPFH domain-containing protein [Streptomonospora nanhaiensis]|uniref:Regulator of protease activity HflC (Stomatin/prohibitin superfamily) n=1 Tax=Streptomonospora nanhaiensis TaxID=1323731 RepID=A0A853BV30_9ACTN|nr:SPFH domain-containing protein [Streptomonospora nanhaiensis]MBV2363594.1 SPFH domain-containing protein [Streptomonospora nanhaiensis]MBX9391627.1 SPFH domain-containing protein [Streptomonospora nanhaiensis]NYI98636.1 regulator of protease activity HflC (stomatin/prohibitin superfamily) [Streptomonospora nanhaiensis]